MFLFCRRASEMENKKPDREKSQQGCAESLQMRMSHGVKPAHREGRPEEETCHKQKNRTFARDAVRDRPPESTEKYSSEEEPRKKGQHDREYFSAVRGRHFLRILYEFLGIPLQPSAMH